MIGAIDGDWNRPVSIGAVTVLRAQASALLKMAGVDPQRWHETRRDIFDQKAILRSYIHENGSADETVLARHLDKKAEEHFGPAGFGSDQVNAADALFEMVQAGELTWHDPPGGDVGGTKALIYRLKEPPR